MAIHPRDTSFVFYTQIEATRMNLNEQDIDKDDNSTYFIKENEAG